MVANMLLQDSLYSYGVQGTANRTTSNHAGGCQNYGRFLSTLNIRCRIIIGIQKGTIILTTNPCRPLR